MCHSLQPKPQLFFPAVNLHHTFNGKTAPTYHLWCRVTNIFELFPLGGATADHPPPSHLYPASSSIIPTRMPLFTKSMNLLSELSSWHLFLILSILVTSNKNLNIFFSWPPCYPHSLQTRGRSVALWQPEIRVTSEEQSPNKSEWLQQTEANLGDTEQETWATLGKRNL